MIEAESYDGPSLILSYASCINHGIMAGMGKAQTEMDLAVNSGYWPLYRYNPQLKDEGKNPFTLDSKKPNGKLQEFLAGEIRYNSLRKTFPDEFSRLSVQLENEYAARYQALSRLAGMEVEETAPASAPVIVAEADDDDPTCTLSGTAEHSRGDGADDPCDDGRGGKI
jgi:pyruvate-ferredoxin/flavodoxin oxidoreductase